MIKEDDALTEFSPFEAKWAQQKSIQTLQPGETKIIRKSQFNDTDRERLCSIQFRTRMAGWLLLTFLIYLHNQLRSGSLNRE